MKAEERTDPPKSASEKEMLASWLDYERDTMLWKIDGVSGQNLRRPMVPSGTSLLGMVKHLGWVERGWFHKTFLGQDVDERVPWTKEDPDADFRIEPGETTQQVIDFYKEECRRSREIVARADVEDHAKRSDRTEFTLRWILIHMIEETARHNGHADILREQIDGVTGE
ncbi:MAG: hypothetical protein QOF16_143 [Actinomycetota bacterium]|jgi:uncharacterized damage-inducible protein DinB|nr:hypothetical protein [Actinomycetota bacterium]